MKKLITSFTCLLLASQSLLATTHTITVSGFTYSPASVSVNVGDTVSIEGSSLHPLVQVDAADWNANNPNPMTGGWGTKTTTYTFTVTSTDTIYYGCANHMASMGMKGMISVNAITSGIQQTSAANAITLYPNPATSRVQFSSLVNVQVYNITGQFITEKQNVNTLDISTLPAGIYTLTLTDKKGATQRTKMVKE